MRCHVIGQEYIAASSGGNGCPHSRLEFNGKNDDWSIACKACHKRWCIKGK